jgi:hypothetical protein
MNTTTTITMRVPLKIRRRSGRKTVVTPLPAASAGTALATRADPTLVKALARAHRYQRMLDEGRYGTISEMAAGEKIDRGYLGRLLRLAVLAPDIVEGLLDGRAWVNAELARMMEPLPMGWGDQRAMLNRPRASSACWRGPSQHSGALRCAATRS